MIIKAFNMPGDSIVITSTYVIDDKMPILYVTHEEDEEDGDSWQFHCGNGDFDMEKMMLVTLENILSIDDALLSVANLPLDHVARRDSATDDWVYYKDH